MPEAAHNCSTFHSMNVEQIVHVRQDSVPNAKCVSCRTSWRFWPNARILILARHGPNVVIPWVWIECTRLQPSCAQFFARTTVKSTNIHTRLRNAEQIEAHDANEWSAEIVPCWKIVTQPVCSPLTRSGICWPSQLERTIRSENALNCSASQGLQRWKMIEIQQRLTYWNEPRASLQP